VFTHLALAMRTHKSTSNFLFLFNSQWGMEGLFQQSFSQMYRPSSCGTHLQIGRTHLHWSTKPIHNFYNEHLRTTRGTKAQEHKTSSSMDTFRTVRIRNTIRSADDLSDCRLQHAKEIASPRIAAELQSFGSNSFPAPKSHRKLYRRCNLC
jgi:hypothetical protein